MTLGLWSHSIDFSNDYSVSSRCLQFGEATTRKCLLDRIEVTELRSGKWGFLAFSVGRGYSDTEEVWNI